MKSSYRSRLGLLGLATLAVCAAFAVSPMARADVESLHENVDLVPAVADATLGGDASLDTTVVGGTTSAVIELSPEGLASGTYNVTAILKSGTDQVSGTNQVALGSFVITGTDPLTSGTDVTFGGPTGTPLPADLSPFNIAGVVISGTDNTAILTGDFTNITDINSGRLHVSVAAESGTASVSGTTVVTGSATVTGTATGHLVINARIHKGKAQGMFNLVAHKLPGNTNLSVAVNGTDVASVFTDRNGNLHIIGVANKNGVARFHGNGGHGHNPHNSPAASLNLFDIGTVSIHYPGGLDVLDIDL